MTAKYAIIFSLALILLLPGVDVRTASGDNNNKNVHTVVKGDTLWDLSENYLNNPFLWPKLWQWNDFITNPHFIYPGDKIRLYPPAVLVKHPVVEEPPETIVEEEEEVAEELEPEVVEESYSTTELRSTGLISAREMKDAGKILDAQDEKVMLSDGDKVYIAQKDSPEVGDLYTVFKREREIIHPVTKKSLGYKIAILGTVKIEAFSEGEGLTTARIIDSFDVVSRGDLVIPKRDIPEKVTLKEVGVEMEGHIVTGKEDRVTFGEGDIIYIDLGEKVGVEAGYSFIVYKKGETIRDKKAKREYTLPPTTIGKLLVLDVSEETSAAVILNSVEEMRAGERIKTVVR